MPSIMSRINLMKKKKNNTEIEEILPLSRQVSVKAGAQFRQVLSKVKLEEAAAIAVEYRRQRDKQLKGLLKYFQRRSLKATLITPPFNGYYNLAYKLEFSDGKAWALKIPRRGHGEQWNGLAKEASFVEINTMKMLKKETQIPMPGVYSYDVTDDNKLQCPFMMMDWLEGVSLLSYWDRYAPRRDIMIDATKRIQLLIDLAKAMVELGQFKFDSCGTPKFDHETGALIGLQQIITRDIGFEDEHTYPPLTQVGPFHNVTQYLSWKLNLTELDPEYRGHVRLFRKLLEWVDEDAFVHQSEEDQERGLSGHTFELAHVDLGPQNVLINNITDCKLAGVIDFDGVTAVPTCLGSGHRGMYPHWLTRDFDLWQGENAPPFLGEQYEQYEHPAPPSSNRGPGNTTTDLDVEQLDYFRAVWRLACENATAIKERNGKQPPPRLTVDDVLDRVPAQYCTGLTPARCVDGRILKIAADSPDVMLVPIVRHILDKILLLNKIKRWLILEHEPHCDVPGLGIFNLNALSTEEARDTSVPIKHIPIHDHRGVLGMGGPSTPLTKYQERLFDTSPSRLRPSHTTAPPPSPEPVVFFAHHPPPSVSSGSPVSSLPPAQVLADLGTAEVLPTRQGALLLSFASKDIIADIGDGTLSEDDWDLLKWWWLFVWAGKK